MAPEYGATLRLFPIDGEKALRYLAPGQVVTKDRIALVEGLCTRKTAFGACGLRNRFTHQPLHLDLGTVVPRIFRPENVRRIHVRLTEAAQVFGRLYFAVCARLPAAPVLEKFRHWLEEGRQVGPNHVCRQLSPAFPAHRSRAEDFNKLHDGSL